jgi:hypothetical protein
MLHRKCGEHRRPGYFVAWISGGAFPAPLSSAMTCFRHSISMFREDGCLNVCGVGPFMIARRYK